MNAVEEAMEDILHCTGHRAEEAGRMGYILDLEAARGLHWGRKGLMLTL